MSNADDSLLDLISGFGGLNVQTPQNRRVLGQIDINQQFSVSVSSIEIVPQDKIR